MNTEIKIFNNGDEPFLKWMDNNPNGYVLNTNRTENSTYTFLHQSKCPHLSGLVEGQGPDGYTTRDYIKVCSEDFFALEDWCVNNRTNFKSFSGYCKTCKPRIPVKRPINYPDEVSEQFMYHEGNVVQVWVNSYERNEKARTSCLQHYGFRCAVCNLDFEDRYGEIGRGFMHVHHKLPLSSIGSHHEVDPVKDLIPVCPNCHAMLHRNTPPYSLEELKSMIKLSGKKHLD